MYSSDDHLGLVSGDDWEDMVYAKFVEGTKDISVRTPKGYAGRG